MVKVANIESFISGGEPHWGQGFAEIFNQAYRAAWGEAFSSGQIFAGGEEVLGYWKGDEPSGVAIFSRIGVGSAQEPYLMMLFVEENQRRTGIATQMLSELATYTRCPKDAIRGEATTEDGKAFALSRMPTVPIYTSPFTELDI